VVANQDNTVQPPRVWLVGGVVATQAYALANEMRRASMLVEVGTADLLRQPPETAIYVFCFDAAIGVALAPQIVAWAQAVQPPPGLVGVIDGGAGADREALLAAGFDDVVAGPPSTRELAARVRAIHRRVHGRASQSRLRFGALTVDTAGHALWVDGAIVPLTAIELAVVRALVSAHGRALSRGDLLDAAWGAGELEVSERAVDNVILRLRRKLPRPDVVETVRGVGFRIAQR